MEGNGIRVVVVLNRKGGCGKSTLVKGLASAAAERGESVTIIDTDKSESSYQWMLNGKERGGWAGDVTVVSSMDTEAILDTFDQIYELPDQEHLILVDTFGGASDALDELVTNAHFVLVPTKLSRSDLTETQQTLNWVGRLKERVPDPSKVPPARVVINAVPARRNEAEAVAMEYIFSEFKTLASPVLQRAAYLRMDLEGMLGPIRDMTPNKPMAAYVDKAINEMDEVLVEIDKIIKCGGKDDG